MVIKKGDGPANVMCGARGLVIVSLLLSACSSFAHAQTSDKADAKAVDGFSAAVARAGAHIIQLRTPAQIVGPCLQVTWRRLSTRQNVIEAEEVVSVPTNFLILRDDVLRGQSKAVSRNIKENIRDENGLCRCHRSKSHLHPLAEP